MKSSQQLILITIFFISTAFPFPIKSPKIIGGTDADIHEFPSMVSILWNRTHWCGGSMISEYWILTAAHCRYPLEAEFEIEYGATELLLTDENAKIAQIELSIGHDDFSFDHALNDIAVIKTIEPMHTGFHIPFAKLGFPGMYYPTGTPAVAIGWGIWSYVNMTFPKLQKIDQKIWNYRDCRELVRGNPFGFDIYRSQICAGIGDLKSGSCDG